MKLGPAIYGCILGIGIICYSCPIFSQANHPVIDFTADTQGPLFVERIIHRLNHNEKATGMLFKEIGQRRPAGLFILGDVVSLGYKNGAWRHVDDYLRLLQGKGIPVYASLGNHEVMLNAAKGEKRFQSSFPMHSKTGYVETIDSVAVILLNSNFSTLTPLEIERQDNWYVKTLQQIDTDAAIKFVIVGCHHPPFTNSRRVKPAVNVQHKFVGPFLHSKKCVLFLSGHSHNFEHFSVGGKQFLVIGGGGGIRQPLYTTNPRTPDLSPNYKPMFHYLEVRRLGDSLKVVSRQLKTDFSGFEDGITIVAKAGKQ